jgi:hypothetical protein
MVFREDYHSYAAMVNVVDWLAQALTDPSKKFDWMVGISEEVVGDMKARVVERINAANLDTLLSSEDARLVLFHWSSWNEPAAVRTKLLPVLDDDSLLESLLSRLLRQGSSYASRDRVSQVTYHLDPQDLERYFNLDDLLGHVEVLQPKLEPGSRAHIAAQQFILGMTRLKVGLPTGSEVFEHD